LHLSSLGYEVFLASRLVIDTPDVLKLGTPILIDWNDDQSLYDACQNMDIIVHAAGMNSGDCSKNPDLAFEFNGIKTGNLVKQARRAGVKKFIYLSTAHVYSSNLSGIIHENTELTNTHVYPSSKVAGENSVTKINAESDTQGIIIRLSNAFGAPTHSTVNCWMLFVNDLCRQIATDQKIIIRSQSNIVRNFITLTDVCRALEFIISRDLSINSSKIYNLGDKSKTLMEMASMIRHTYSEIRNIDIPIIELSEKTEYKQNLKYRSKLIKSEGWHATSNFSFEIRELIEFCEAKFVCNGSI
jgi:UDP-glucose 4-epimerase